MLIIDDAPQFTCGTYVLCITTHHAVGDLSSMMGFTYAYARRFTTKPYPSTVLKHWSRDHLKYFDTPSTPATILPLLASIPGLAILPPDQPLPPSLSASQLTSPTSTRKFTVVILERILMEPKVIRNRTSLRRETGDSPHRRSFSFAPHVVSNLGWTGQFWHLETLHVLALRGLNPCSCQDEYRCHRRQRRWRITLSAIQRWGSPCCRWESKR